MQRLKWPVPCPFFIDGTSRIFFCDFSAAFMIFSASAGLSSFSAINWARL
jgi:hypothetical protein